MLSAEYLLEMRDIEKSFPGVRALRGIHLELRPGEILALIGENGAGKSTLIKVLGGAHEPDAGKVFIDGHEVSISSPQESQSEGIGIIYQEFNLVPFLSARENIFLGREISRAGIIQKKAESRKARALFEKLGLEIDPETLCADLSIAEQQAVEIAKALSTDVRILVLDEPSATLTLQEVEKLFTILRDLRDQGIGMIYISHRLDEIFEIADRVLVLRDGEHVGTSEIDQIDRPRLIEMMVGRNIENEFPEHHHPVGDVRLRVQSLSRGEKVRGVSFEARAGEVLGITGLVGAGRTELLRLLFGADLPDDGSVTLDGRKLSIESPRDAIREGIGLLAEDRKGQGLVLGHSVRDNFSLPTLDYFSTLGVVHAKRENDCLAKYVKSLSIKLPHFEQAAGNLSGGNQQKVVLAKWLQRDCDVILIDEPTRGIDVGAKYEIYLLIHDLAKQGKVIIIVSSELPEVLAISDRILVMRSGVISGEISDAKSANQEQIMELAVH